jgi:spore germination cell wall hydrolase CwlJ-like protein
MTDADLLTLCALREAGNQPDDGVAAVCKVVLNRVRLHYDCDGTISGAILRHAAFSWTEFEFRDDAYVRVAFTPEAQLAHVEASFAQGKDSAGWARCARIAAEVQAGTYRGLMYGRLTADTVLYYAPSGASAPAWARPLAFVVQIGGQRFYRDISHMAPTELAKVAPQGAHTVEIDV